jgi:hypothetical protein
MSDRQLQNILNALALTVLVFAASCEIESCDACGGTWEMKSTAYKGKPGALEPYAEDPKITPGPGTCDKQNCGYFPVVTVKLHNPFHAEVGVDVHCSFFVGDWKAKTSKRTGVKMKARSSKVVEMQFNVDVQGGRTSTFGATCDAYFK